MWWMLSVLAVASDPDALVVVSDTGVASPRGRSVVAVEVVDRAEIEASGAQDVAGVLMAVPGVDVQQGRFGAEVRLRGMEADQVLVLVDGVRLLGARDGVLDLSRIPVAQIEQIEVVKGPASALYGSDALGGVIHILTRMPSDPEGRVLAQVRSPTAGDVTASGSFRHRDVGVRLSAGLHAVDAWDLDPADPGTDGSRSVQAEVQAGVQYDPSGDVQVRADLGSLRRDLTGVDVGAGGAVIDRTNRIEEHRGSVQVRWLPTASTAVRLQAAGSLFRDQFLLDQRDSDALDRYEDASETIGRGLARVDQVVGAHALSVGVDVERISVESPRLQARRGGRTRGAVFAQDQIDLGPARVAPGLRVELDSWFGVAVAPKLAVRLDPSDAWVLRGSVGTGYRAPSLRELSLRFENPGAGYVVEGSPDLRPELATTVDLALERQVGDAWVSVAGFYTHATDLITTDLMADGGPSQPQRFAYANVAEARLGGVEVGVDGELSPGVSLSLSYAGLLTHDLDRDGPLSGRATHRVNGMLTTHVDPLATSFTVRGSVASARPFWVVGPDEDTLARGPALARLDARAQTRLSRRVHAFVLVDNLFNAGSLPTDPIAPRRGAVGLSVQLGPSDSLEE